MLSTRLIEQLHWYLAKPDVSVDADRVTGGGALAIIGAPADDIAGFADRIAPERPVLDLRHVRPSANAVRERFTAHPETIVLAARPHHVLDAIGFIAQPYYLPVAALRTRPHDAIPLLRQAVAQLGVVRPLEELGDDAMAGLHAYRWPRGLHELREASWRIGACLDGGTVTAGARRAGVSRQALSKYLERRLA